MPYKTGSWGKEAKKRSLKRKEYFLKRSRRIYGNKNINPKLYRIGELEAIKLLNGSIDRNKDTTGSYDISWQDKKIDVKTDIFSDYHGSWGWQFDCSKQKGKVDYFLCIAKNMDKQTKYIFLIPDNSFPTKTIWISLKNINKYEKYLFRNGVKKK